MWTATFDERLQLNLTAIQDQDIIPPHIIQLLTHPIHTDQPEHWVPASQHYACPRTIEKHQTRARCGTISRAVTGYLYKHHTTGKRNRHTCVACQQQWHRSGHCYAIIITNYRHTLQVFLESPPPKLLHDHNTWVANYLATYEPLLPQRDTPPYRSDPDNTTRIELDTAASAKLWAALYQPLTPTATNQILHIQATRFIRPPEAS